ncbi:MAG: GspE/PulE family protein [Candidatus Moranbacteria bacterium]|nr:GspE/PulE family protein [Candidatus Moranbacteria bacterium]
MVKVFRKTLPADKEKDIRASQVLRRMRKESEEEQAAALAKKHNLFYVDLNLFPLSGDELRSLPEEEARRFQVAVFQKAGKNIRLALTNPGSRETLDYVKKLQQENGWNIRLYVVSLSSLSKALNKYKETPLLENLDALRLSLSGKDLEEFEREFKDLLELKKRIREIPTTQIITTIMAGAVKMKASDIHFEPQEEEVRLRYRLDGVLQDVGYLPLDIYRFIISRVKMMGGMKLNIRDIAQDGHFNVNLENGLINIRVSIIPGNRGESIVMRLLNQADVLLRVEELGLRGLAYEQVQKQTEKPHGMILNTGPTGSGKTTTLYAVLNRINVPGVKIITIEDPVEYEIKGISQTQVSKSRGYTFEKGLRAIVRQDPDVILVGEIRDEETADIALNAALTGHLVLSTIHTNSAAGAVPRLIELGVKPNLIAPAVSALIAQRLVRKICPHCREVYQPAKETANSIKKILAIISPKSKMEIPKDILQLYRPKGCPRCHNLGYRGRIGVFEVLTMSESIEKLILNMASEGEITQAALEEGMITMAQDGIMKAIEGITSLEEVWRVTGQTEFLEEIYEKLMEQSLSRAIEIPQEDLEKVSKNTSSFEKFAEFLKGANQKDALRYVIAAALLLSAGDIHIEPEEKEVLVRLRIDGILQTIGRIPLNEYPTFLGEIKILSGLKAELRQGVKDSRFSIAIDRPFKNITEIKVDVRVSIILGGYGETVVMRLLNRGAVALDVDKLGIRKQNLDKILHEIKKPNGFFLNTGPTGSGKTTTLYSLLRVLNKPEVKVITVEDPIEYQLTGILQTQVSDKEGYTFPTALRSLLRQNPDIMMIGEIRDEETAGIAVQSALTGHLVLSTLHTNDAPGAIPRLLNMGVRTDDLATAANGFMAQRLVRKLCECREKIKPTAEEKEKIKNIIKSISPKAGVKIPPGSYIYKPKGCAKCNGIGYKGRTTVSEVLVIDKAVQEMIYANELSTHIRDKAIENGMLTMQQDGILKVLEGETTLEEVERVTEE